MPTTALYKIKHTCGCVEDHDLSSRKSFDRKGFAEWLTKQPCRNHDPKRIAERNKWIASKRAEEAAETAAAEQRFGLTPLSSGTDKMRAYATTIRVDLVRAAFETFDLDEDDFAHQVAEPASIVDSARWWIDNKNLDPADLPAALAEAISDPDVDSGTENPY